MTAILDAGGRVISVDSETDLVMGRVFYTVAKVGTFTLEPEESRAADGERIQVHYGRAPGTYWSDYQGPMPEAPAVYSVTLGGGAVVRVEAALDPTLRPWQWLACRRAQQPHTYVGAGRVPDGTHDRVAAIVRALVGDYVARADLEAVKAAQRARLAPALIAGAQRSITDLHDRIEALQAEIAQHQAIIDMQRTYLPPEPAGVST